MTNRIGGITWSNGANYYANLIVREKIHIYAARGLVFFNFHHFFFNDILHANRHVPTH